MPGSTKVPTSGCQWPSLGAISVPSTVVVTCGLGRRYAVISWARISSTLSASAFKAGLEASKRAFTWSQVRALGALEGPGADVCPYAAAGTASKARMDPAPIRLSFIMRVHSSHACDCFCDRRSGIYRGAVLGGGRRARPQRVTERDLTVRHRIVGGQK